MNTKFRVQFSFLSLQKERLKKSAKVRVQLISVRKFCVNSVVNLNVHVTKLEMATPTGS